MRTTELVQRRASGPDVMLGIDVGGSGSRAAIIPVDGGRRRQISGPRTSVGAGGSRVPELVRTLIDEAAEAWPHDLANVAGIGIGATGLASLVESPADLVADLAHETGVPVVAAIDAVTAHLGALSGDGGAVVALGTGAIAIGHPGMSPAGSCPPHWRRVDGWGHLLGDRGGGAWVGRRALEQALRAHDGVDTAGIALLGAGRERFGDPRDWPVQLYTRADRAGVLAEFAADVVSLARSGDPASVRLLTEAGEEAAQSALAALAPGYPAEVVLTGGLVRAGGALERGFRQQIASHPGEVHVRRPCGEPVDGSLMLAQMSAAGRAESQEGFVWT